MPRSRGSMNSFSFSWSNASARGQLRGRPAASTTIVSGAARRSTPSRPAGTEEPASHEYRAPKPASASRVAHPSSSTLLGTTTVICVPVSSCAAAASSSGNNRARLSGEQCTKVFCPTKESAPTSEAAAGGWRCIAPSHQGAPGSRTEREWFPAYE